CLFSYDPPDTTPIYTLSLHDALPIWLEPARRLRLVLPLLPRSCVVSRPRHDAARDAARLGRLERRSGKRRPADAIALGPPAAERSEEHTSELQSQSNLVCRLLLEKKK